MKNYQPPGEYYKAMEVNLNLYKGFVRTKGKQPIDKLKSGVYRDWEEIKQYNSYAGVLQDDVILIDINDSKQAEDLCHDVIYLIEPSIIKLNKLMLVNSSVFKMLKDKKVILNQSLLSSKDVLDFEYESGLKIYYNMPPLDEREKSIYALNAFLVRLGFSKQKSEEQEKKKSILGIFGK